MKRQNWSGWLLALLTGVGIGLACGYDTSPPDESWQVADAGESGPDGSTGSPDAGGSGGGETLDGGAETDGGRPGAPDGGRPGGPDGSTPGGGCTSATQCDDQNPCTQDTCTPQGQCTYEAVDGGCTQAGRTGCCERGFCCVGPLCCQ